MTKITTKDLLDAGVHFGHLTRKWDPQMAPFIFMEKNGIHIIDLNKSLKLLEEASAALQGVVRSGRKIMFVATKKQAKEVVEEQAKKLKMPYVTERWLGGMLTNFATIRKSLKKMTTIDKLLKEDAYNNLAKRERLMLSRERAKLERVLGGIADLNRLPSALFVVDIKREHCDRRGAEIKYTCLCDGRHQFNPMKLTILFNDDSFKSISLIANHLGNAMELGLNQRKKKRRFKNS